MAGEPLPSLTLIGSSNYGRYFTLGILHEFVMWLFCEGHRSLSRDLEAQAAIVTSNQQLREALHTVCTCVL